MADPRCQRYSGQWASGRFGGSGIDRHMYRAGDGKSRSGAPSSFSVRPADWYSKYGERDRSMSLRASEGGRSGARSVPPEMMVSTRAKEDDEIDSLMQQMEHELNEKRKLRQEINQCKEILRQHRQVESRARKSGGTNFDALAYSRARGPQRVKISGLFPNIPHPASYRLDLL